MSNSANIFIGIDPSLTGTGLALHVPGDPDSLNTAVVGSGPAGSLIGRVRRYEDLLLRVLDWLPVSIESVDGVAIEGYSFGSKGRGIYDRVEFGGILRYELIREWEYPIVEVPPATLKLFICGKGGGPSTDKAGVRLATYKRYGKEFDNDNECDAYVLARIAACFFGAEEPATEFQRRAMAKLQS